MTERITPVTYTRMNEEFIREGTLFRILPTTQEEIDERIKRDKNCFPTAKHNPPDTLKADKDT